jgi:hypothetical protein
LPTVARPSSIVLSAQQVGTPCAQGGVRRAWNPTAPGGTLPQLGDSPRTPTTGRHTQRGAAVRRARPRSPYSRRSQHLRQPSGDDGRFHYNAPRAFVHTPAAGGCLNAAPDRPRACRACPQSSLTGCQRMRILRGINAPCRTRGVPGRVPRSRWQASSHGRRRVRVSRSSPGDTLGLIATTEENG